MIGPPFLDFHFAKVGEPLGREKLGAPARDLSPVPVLRPPLSAQRETEFMVQ
jgi:hypothetical protein